MSDNDDASRGKMEGVCEGIRDSKAIYFAYAIKDRQQERGYTCQQRCPALRSAFESVSGSRVSAGGKGSRLREVWSCPQLPPRGGVEESLESVVADGEQEPVGVPFGEDAARCPVYGQLPGHQIGAWVVSEGG